MWQAGPFYQNLALARLQRLRDNRYFLVSGAISCKQNGFAVGQQFR